MLNHEGGRVLFGVSPKGELTGQEVSDKTVQDLVAELQRLDPPVFPEIERVTLENGREVIVVSVPRGVRRPYSVRGKGAFKRVGNTTLVMSGDEYQQMLLEQLHSTQRWENQATDWTVADLDTGELVKTVEQAIGRGRLADPNTRDPLAILRGLGLLSREGELLRAAVVLFAKRDKFLPDFPQCQLRVARFRGTDKTEFLDNRQFHGHAFALLERAERYLVENLPVAGRIIPNLFERQDDPLYPPVALREALANAFCHRDYEIGGGSVGVAIFDDRLEITSSGGLHFGLTVPDLYKPHESLPWNPLIAKVFYIRGIIEAWGRGTLKIVELTERAGLPRPDIESVSGAVTVRFLPSRYVAPKRVGHDLSSRHRAILQVLGEGQALLAGQIHSRVASDSSLRQLRDDLALLKKLNLVELKGHGRGAYWSLKPIEEN